MDNQDLALQAVMRAYFNEQKTPDPDLVGAIVKEVVMALEGHRERQERRLERMQSTLKQIVRTARAEQLLP